MTKPDEHCSSLSNSLVVPSPLEVNLDQCQAGLDYKGFIDLICVPTVAARQSVSDTFTQNVSNMNLLRRGLKMGPF